METTPLGRTEGRALKGSFILEVLFVRVLNMTQGTQDWSAPTLVGLHQGLVTWGI